MNKVEVNKEDLIEILEANRERHHREAKLQFELAIKAAEKELIDRLEGLKDGEINLYFDLPMPEDHTADYDRVIGMLKMDVNATVDLTTQEYKNYVEDNWAWKDEFRANSTFYGAHGR